MVGVRGWEWGGVRDRRRGRGVKGDRGDKERTWNVRSCEYSIGYVHEMMYG